MSESTTPKELLDQLADATTAEELLLVDAKFKVLDAHRARNADTGA